MHRLASRAVMRGRPQPRFASSSAAPEARPFYRRRPIVFWTLALPVTIASSLGVVTLGLLAYDASTYNSRSRNLKARVPEHPLVLEELERGGIKGLKVARVLVDDADAEQESGIVSKEKPKLVIIGGGWGSVGIIKHLNPDDWHVTVVAPDNYFLFHPLLPSATVGTVEVRSLCEPLRKILARVKGHFLQAKAVDLDMKSQLVEIQGEHGAENFYLPYDKLVIACGSTNSTHGVPGLANCFQLKTISDAQAIRRRIMENLETAALPNTEEVERKRLLSFVICGGGPTGVEMASELFDMVNEDVIDFMPALLRHDLSISIIQSRDHLLNTYSQTISEYAEAKFSRDEIHTVVNARVKAVTADSVTYTLKNRDGTTTEHTIPSGFTLWSTGIAMNPFTTQVASLLQNQYHKHALEVDSHLRVLGAPLGTVYALGDCATIETNLVDHLLGIVERCDANKDGVIDEQEFESMMKIVQRKFPTAQIHVEKLRDVFEQYASKEHTLDLDGLAALFINISKSMTALPATAQVANQQGVYLGKKLAKMSAAIKSGSGYDQAIAHNDIYDDPEDVYSTFKFRNLGMLAYLGNSAVFDLGGYSFAGGLIAMYMWRGVYWSEQVSMRSRCLLIIDWIKRGVWGRDLSKF